VTVAKRIMAVDPSVLSEAQWSELFVEIARIGQWAPRYHTVVSRYSKRGFLDWQLLKGPRVLNVELKTEEGKVTPQQQEWIDAWRVVEAATKGLVQVYVWRPSDYDEVVEVLTGRRPRKEAA
jgi:hypothetical protein